MLRSEFLALLPVSVWTAACGATEPNPNPNPNPSAKVSAGSAGAGADPNGAGGVSSQGTSGSGAGVGEASGGSGGPGGSVGGAGSMGGKPASVAQGGSGGAANVAECVADGFEVGAVALAVDFSKNSESGTNDQHTLIMSRGAMLRQQLDYQTTGEDHAHTIAFTVAQLGTLLTGETVVVETEGPPLNASSGHRHTVTVRSCPGAPW